MPQNDSGRRVFEWYDDYYIRGTKQWTLRCDSEETAVIYQDGELREKVADNKVVDLKKYSKKGLIGKSDIVVFRYHTDNMMVGYDFKSRSLDQQPITGRCTVNLGVNKPEMFNRLKNHAVATDRLLSDYTGHRKVVMESDLADLVSDAVLSVVNDVINITSVRYMFERRTSRMIEMTGGDPSHGGLQENCVKLLNYKPTMGDYGLYAREFIFEFDPNIYDSIVERDTRYELEKGSENKRKQLDAESEHNLNKLLLDYALEFEKKMNNSTKDLGRE